MLKNGLEDSISARAFATNSPQYASECQRTIAFRAKQRLMPSLERFEFLLNSSGDPFGVEAELMHKEIGGALHDVAVGNA